MKAVLNGKKNSASCRAYHLCHSGAIKFKSNRPSSQGDPKELLACLWVIEKSSNTLKHGIIKLQIIWIYDGIFIAE